MADKFFVVAQRSYVVVLNYNGTCSTRTDRVENKLTQIFFYIIPEDSSSSSGLVGDGNPMIFVTVQKSLDSR